LVYSQIWLNLPVKVFFLGANSQIVVTKFLSGNFLKRVNLKIIAKILEIFCKTFKIIKLKKRTLLPMDDRHIGY
jgi:hypothetical protein